MDRDRHKIWEIGGLFMTHSFYRSYGFLAAMLGCIVLGCAVGAAWRRLS